MPAPDPADYDHILLDMNGTFLFGFDRFGRGEDFGATYARLGYTQVPTAIAQARVRAAYDYLAVRYIDEAYYQSFPSVERALRETAPTGEPDTATLLAELVDTFAQHELGHLPPAHGEALGWLAGRRPLSVLSNLWSPPPRWHALLEELGLRQNFRSLFFSSDGPEIKPHAAFFERALHEIGVPARQVLFVGDSYRCDVAGARGVGMDVVWLHGERTPPDPLPEGVWGARDLVSWTNQLRSLPAVATRG